MNIFKRAILIMTFTLATACHVGPQIEQSDIARQPQGVSVVIDVMRAGQRERAEQTGELLDVRDDGLIIATQNESDEAKRIVLVPWKFIYKARASDVSGYAMRYSQGDSQREESIEKLSRVSRFPQGLSPALLEILLANTGQAKLDIFE